MKRKVPRLRVVCLLAAVALTCGAVAAAPAMAASSAVPPTPVLSTSPGSSCSASNPTVVGNGSVDLQAAVSDSAASGSVMVVGFAVYANGDRRDTVTSNAIETIDAPSGTTATLMLSRAELQSAASTYGSDGEVAVTWKAWAAPETSTGAPQPPYSHPASCTFVFNDTTPDAPSLWTDSGDTDACTTLAGGTIGTPVTVYATSDAATASAAPVSYSYSLNGGSPVTVSAATTAPYEATLTVTPTSGFSELSVTAFGPGGNVSAATTCGITASQPGPEADQDLSGDGIPDLVTVGADNNDFAPGLWLADGEGSDGEFNGTVNTAATDIAPDGTQGIGTPASWDGLQAIIGQFDGPGYNAVQAYDPGTGDAFIMAGLGNGTVNPFTEESADFGFQPYIDANGDTNASPDFPLQLVDAYNVSGDDEPYPDEMGTVDDPTLGSFLAYYASDDAVGGFDAGSGGSPYLLSNDTPDGTMDWNDWTITTAAAPPGAETPSGAPVLAEMYLWNSQTGALYLWELTGLSNEVAGGIGISPSGGIVFTNATATVDYTQITVDPGTSADAGWNTGSTLATLQATQINGAAGLIDVTSTGQVQSWSVDIDDSSATAAINQVNAADSTQELQTAS